MICHLVYYQINESISFFHNAHRSVVDDEEDVEALCQDVISDMETVLGEPLQKYF